MSGLDEARASLAATWARIGEKRAALKVSEGTTSARNILRTVPLKAVPCAHARAGCNYPEGDCAELCLPGGVRP